MGRVCRCWSHYENTSFFSEETFSRSNTTMRYVVQIKTCFPEKRCWNMGLGLGVRATSAATPRCTRNSSRNWPNCTTNRLPSFSRRATSPTSPPCTPWARCFPVSSTNASQRPSLFCSFYLPSSGGTITWLLYFVLCKTAEWCNLPGFKWACVQCWLGFFVLLLCVFHGDHLVD